MTEDCIATDAVALVVGEQGATLTPPSGWTYAKLPTRAVAVGSNGKSLLTVSELASSDPLAVEGSLQRLLAAAEISLVKFDALKKRLKKPQISVEARGTTVDLWEVSKLTGNGENPRLREHGSGTLLIFVAKFSESHVATGLGFVVVPDAQADAEKVMQAVQSLKDKP